MIAKKAGARGGMSRTTMGTMCRLLSFVLLIGTCTLFYESSSQWSSSSSTSSSTTQSSSTLLRMVQTLETNHPSMTSFTKSVAEHAQQQQQQHDVQLSNLLDGLQTPEMRNNMMASCPAPLRLNLPPAMTQPEFIEALFDGLEQTQVKADPLDYVANNFDKLVQERGALPSGFWAEFGVYKGKTLTKAYQQLHHPIKNKHGLFTGILAGFDSFEGLPEKWRQYGQGYFTTPFDEVRQNVPQDVVLKKGWFQNTIGEFLVEHPRLPATLINHDGDLFVSTAITFSLTNERIVPGTILCHDELFGYPGYAAHEILALFLWMKQVNATLCPLAVMSPLNRTHVSDNLMAQQAPAPKQAACFQVLDVGRRQ